MSEERLIRSLRALDRPVEVDPAFGEALFAILEGEYARRRQFRPRLTLLLVAALLTALLVGGAIAVGSGLVRLPAPDARIVAPSPEIDAGCQLAPAPAATRVTEITTGSPPNTVAFAACSYWVGSWTTDAVQRIDPATNEIVATITLGHRDGYVADVAADGDAVWVYTVDFEVRRLRRIDPSTDSIVQQIELPSSFGSKMLIVDGQAWFHGFEYHRLGVVDLATGRIVHDVEWGYDLPRFAGFGALWAMGDRSIVRIDPSTLERTSVEVPHPDAYLAGVSATGLWVTSQEEGRVYRLSPHGDILQVIDSVPLPCCPVTVGGNVYVMSLRDLGPEGTVISAIVRIDDQTGEVIERLDYPAGSGSEGPWVAGGSLWVGNNKIPTMIRYEVRVRP